jgi:hypothetical protein
MRKLEAFAGRVQSLLRVPHFEDWLAIQNAAPTSQTVQEVVYLREFGKGEADRVRFDSALLFQFFLELPFREFAVAGFERFPNQLALDSEDRIIPVVR